MSDDAGKDALYERMRRQEAVNLLDSGELINLTEAARLIGISKSTMFYRTKMGYKPNPVGRIGHVIVYWRSDAVAARDAREQEAS